MYDEGVVTHRPLIERLYRREMSLLPVTSPLSLCAPLLRQAQYDRSIKEHIIHSMLPIIFQYAMRIYLRTHMDPMELVGMGNATLIEEWERAQAQEEPLRYLLNIVRMSMLGYIRQFVRGPITMPDRGGEEYPQYEFLDILHDADTLDDLLGGDEEVQETTTLILSLCMRHCRHSRQSEHVSSLLPYLVSLAVLQARW